MPIFYDTHAHLDDGSFRRDLAEVLQRAHGAGIGRIITIGVDDESSRAAVQLAQEHPHVYAAVGWHPNHAAEAPEEVRPALRALAQHPKVVAIGEIGLDYKYLPSLQGGSPADDARHKDRQAQLFAQQMDLAVELGLPVVVHQRFSMPDILAQMQPYVGRLRAVFHCFSESPDVARRILDMHCLVSYTGILTYKNGQNVRDSLAAVPLGSFMLETDCPYMTPEPWRKSARRCEPAFVADIAAVAAQVKGCSLAELSAATCATACRFFHKMPPPDA
ncbi:MAG: TatD family hydrolase [Verrucomicrobiae bacterium]|nr:TatD family hydrolase [Verrucomicrobiae bacterium]